MQELLDHRDTQEKKVTKESLDLPDPREHQEPLDPLDHQDHEVCEEMKVQLDQVETT